MKACFLQPACAEPFPAITLGIIARASRFLSTARTNIISLALGCDRERSSTKPRGAEWERRLTRFNRKPVSRPGAARQRGDGGKSRPRPRSEHRNLFAAGETIAESGIYQVIHHNAHRETHESVLVKGSSFPFCDACEAKVRFQAVRIAPYIFDDEDFGEE
jgi:hypothetical protein